MYLFNIVKDENQKEVAEIVSPDGKVLGKIIQKSDRRENISQSAEELVKHLNNPLDDSQTRAVGYKATQVSFGFRATVDDDFEEGEDPSQVETAFGNCIAVVDSWESAMTIKDELNRNIVQG